MAQLPAPVANAGDLLGGDLYCDLIFPIRQRGCLLDRSLQRVLLADGGAADSPLSPHGEKLQLGPFAGKDCSEF